MSFVDVVFFTYIFISLYMLFLFVLIYFPSRDRIFSYPKGKPEPVSIIMPCYNEEEHIAEALDALLRLDYPKEMIEIIVVDDKSTDNSANIVRKYAENDKRIRLIVNQRNSGGAAEPTNIGVKSARYDYIAVTDADSTPDKDALMKMIGYLQNDKKAGAVTCSVLSKKPATFIQKLQEIEYLIIAFNRKLLDCVDAVYVTPGPFALYRKKTLLEVGLFDTKNMTQDIEIVWRMLSYGYVARMCLATHVRSATPKKFKVWWKQRIRWNIGGTQTIWKYKRLLFKRGMLGGFIIPFFSISLFLGLFGLCLFLYLWTRKILVSYLSTKYSLAASTAVIRLQDLTFTPSVLNFFGFVLFLLGLWFTFFALRIMKEYGPHFKSLFNVIFYIIIYLAIYPLIMITGLFKLITGKYSW
jgi:cellulose synthase/poly-beta-1,6-N-acetylglucosamine synthase-like glycosyltransferase